ncbi:MAG: nitroreductase family protein [Christensenellaceae bacterium]
MTYQDIHELYLHRQSCRTFAETPIARETVEAVCQAALLAPSACNAQPWRLIAVAGEKKKELTPLLQRLGMNQFLTAAPVIIVIAEAEASCNAAIRKRVKEYLPFDLGGLASHLVLAADAAGLGACIVGWRQEDKIKELLGLDENVSVPAVVAMGYPKPDTPIRPKVRKAFEDGFTYLE